MDDRKRVIDLAVTSRMAMFFWQVKSNTFLTDHDARVFISPKNPDDPMTSLSRLIESIYGGYRRWDAHYFLHIAEHGYTYENTLAFYPLYPLIVRFVTCLIQLINPIELSFRDTSLLVAIGLNVYFFTKAALTLCELTSYIFRNSSFTIITLTLFCFNPASIFFSAPYTESLFSWLSFSVMLNCIKGDVSKAALPFMLSVMCRSNGIINYGFILYYGSQHAIKAPTFGGFLKKCWRMIFCAICGAGMFLSIQYYHYTIYCQKKEFPMKDYVIDFGQAKDYVLAGEYEEGKSPWCSERWPFSFFYVQERYWNVGLFRYYQWKQTPNFLLAAPVLILLISQTSLTIFRNFVIIFKFGHEFYLRQTKLSSEQFVYVLHALFLSVFCLLIVNVQVSTRMLASSSPYLYWCCGRYFYRAHCQESGFQMFMESKTKMTIFISVWFLLYCFIGTTLFCNFFPWT